MVEDRKLAVLRAIVEDYVATQEPVGSKALVDRHRLGVSPATVRNDMAALEEEGLITQPHTSAGRIPTDKGYRLFVDRLSQVKPLSRRGEARDRHAPRGRDRPRRRGPAQRPAARPADPPGRDRAVPDAVALDGPPRRGGAADRRAGAGGADPLDRPRRAARRRAARGARRRADRRPAGRLNRTIVGERLADAAAQRWSAARRVRPGPRGPVAVLVAALVEAMSDHRSDERVAVGGTANLARFGDGFDLAIRPMLEALEEHVVLLKLLGEASSPSTVTVRIGHEGPYQELASTSVVATGYGPGDEALRPWASWGRPAWTTQGRWRRCARWRATSPGSSTKDEQQL